MKEFVLPLFALALSACETFTPASVHPALLHQAGIPPAGGDLLNSVAPAVDHHKHLMGPAIVRIASGPAINPEVNVPPQVEALLRARENAWNDRNALLPLFAREATVLADTRAGWISGADAVAEFLSTRFARPYAITPIRYESEGNTAQLFGYYTRGEGETRQYLGYLHLSLVRAAGIGWRIAAEVPRFPMAPGQQGKTAEHLVAEMDDAGISISVVLSEGFWADGSLLQHENPYAAVMAENDWTAQQVGQFPDRLIAFCSFNPVADHALRELERCAGNPVFEGLKFSFAMSGVDLKSSTHVAKLRAVFAAANARRLPIVVHTRGGPDYGAEHVEIFLHSVMPAAPDIIVQIAHLWGGEAYSRPALRAFADAVIAGLPPTRNLLFDLSEITATVAGTSTRVRREEIAELVRQIGVNRMLFGSDGDNAAQSWRSLIGFIPLNESEYRTIASNVAPYIRSRRSARP